MQPAAKPFDIYYLSESAVTLQFGTVISEELLQQISCYNTLLTKNPFAGFCATVPAYATLTVFYDPLIVAADNSLPGRNGYEKVTGYLYNLSRYNESLPAVESKTISIPVCYGGRLGPDLDEVARGLQLTTDEVIDLHASVVYKVYMMGFVPGFAYLGGLDKQLIVPRKATPRKAVPAGAVGLAGAQTGIYPLQTPGGWQLIGRTPLQLFYAGRSQPSLLKTGDRVVFKKITPPEFVILSHRQHADTNN